MEYLKVIYDKCKADGHFNKFDSFDDFTAYFKDDVYYKKLHSFLLSKDYKVPDLAEFLKKSRENASKPEAIKGTTKRGATKKSTTKKTGNKTGAFKQPLSAVGSLEYTEDGLHRLPDIIKVGLLGADGLQDDLPAMIPFRGSNGVGYWFSTKEQKEIANKSIQLLAYRLLLSIPNHQARVCIIDNEKNGSSFSALFGLDDKILEPEIWDDENEISDGLNDIKNQVPVILSKFLQNKYADLAEYNETIPHSNQPFQFILIANFPRGFNQESAEKLKNLIENGSKAGVYVLISFDESITSEQGIDCKDFRKTIPLIDLAANQIENIPDNEVFNHKYYLTAFETKLPSNLDELKKQLNKAINEVKSVSVNISDITGEEWGESAASGIKIPIGLTPSNEIMDLVFGLNTDSHHALIGGATGSGKSVLLHNIIVNGATLYSPEDLQYILLDYKEGTEFKVYEKLPHTKILSVDSEREFGLSVMEFLVEEITRRGSLFKDVGVGILNDYIQQSGEILPRYIMIIDEFQVLLSGNDTLSTKASQLLEDISRRGRSFGVNMVLATQSLGDVDISSSTLSNIGLRIGMKMTEMDCSRILGIENDVPLKFSRPGEAVYNARNGIMEGNQLFQVAFITKEEIKNRVGHFARKSPDPSFKRFINDDQKSAFVEDNSVLNERIENNSFEINNNYADLYIGAPATLKEDHEFIRIRKRDESNVLIVGDDPGSAISITYYSLFQLIKQSHKESEFYIFNLFDIDSGFQEGLENLEAMGNHVKIFSKSKPLEMTLEKIKGELQKRIEEEGSPGRIVLVILGMQKLRDLRKDGYGDESPLAIKLAEILKDGPDCGIHSFIQIQNHNQLLEIFDSKILNEFENKILCKSAEVSQFVEDYSYKNISEAGIAYLISPQSNNGIDIVKLYQKEKK